MKLTEHCNENDFFRARNFLREVFLLNDSCQASKSGFNKAVVNFNCLSRFLNIQGRFGDFTKLRRGAENCR